MVDFGSDLRRRTLVLCATLAIATAFSVLLRKRRSSIHWYFGAFAVDFGLWYLAQSFYAFFEADIWVRSTAVLSILMPQFALRLFDKMLPLSGQERSPLPRIATIVAVPILILVASPLHVRGWARGIVYFYAIGFIGIGLAAFVRRGNASPSRAIQRRVRYLTVVAALASTLGFADFLWFIGAELPPVGAVLSTIFLYALAQSIDADRLLDLYELLGRLVVATALAFIIGFIFFICVTVIGGFDTMYLNAVLAAVMIIVLYDPVRTKVEEQIHQLIFRERFDLEGVVADIRRRLIHTLEQEALERTVLEGLEASRRVTKAGLYLRNADGTALELAGGIGCHPPERIEIAAASALIERVTRSGSVVLERATRDSLESIGEPHESKPVAMASSVLGPLGEGVVLGIPADDMEVLGLLVVVDDRVKDAFSPEEVVLMESLAAQIGVVMQNTRVHANMKVRERLATVGQMATGLAHEIKNPLGAIKGAAQLLVDPAGDDEGLSAQNQEFLSIILEEVDRLDRVVTSVLDFARPSAKSDGDVDVNAVILRTAQILGPSAGEDVRIETDLAPNLPLAQMDAEKLRQVLLNLVRNASQAMGGQGRVQIRTRKRKATSRWNAQTPPFGWVEISIRDEGPGIAKSVLKNLFVPFFTTKEKGTGLGLPISQRIVQGAGGAIEVESREGRGTTFSVVLPASDRFSSRPQQRVAATPSGNQGNVPLDAS